MTEAVHPVDAGRLRHEVKAKYREVAQDPTADFHFHTGRVHALRLGYPLSPLDQLPEAACEAFAGVANPFHWDHPQPGEYVVDLGSGAGMDAFLASRPIVAPTSPRWDATSSPATASTAPSAA